MIYPFNYNCYGGSPLFWSAYNRWHSTPIFHHHCHRGSNDWMKWLMMSEMIKFTSNSITDVFASFRNKPQNSYQSFYPYVQF